MEENIEIYDGKDILKLTGIDVYDYINSLMNTHELKNGFKNLIVQLLSRKIGTMALIILSQWGKKIIFLFISAILYNVLFNFN